MQKVKRVVIVGAGSMVREHIRAFKANNDVEIAGIYSRTYAKACGLADEFGIPVVANSLKELYDRANPDLVVVAVNILAAKQVLKSCIEFGVPILTEKPIALNLDESMEVQRYALVKKCNVWVGLNRRYYSATQTVLDDLAESDEPRIIQVLDQQDLDVAARLGHPAQVQRNWMYANSIHLIDYICIFGRGKIVSVDVTDSYDPDRPGLVNASVRFSSGDIGLYTAVWNAPGPWSCVVTTPSVRWEMQPLEVARFVKRGTRHASEAPIDIVDQELKAGFFGQARSVLNALEDSSLTGACTIDHALVTTKLVNKIYSV